MKMMTMGDDDDDDDDNDDDDDDAQCNSINHTIFPRSVPNQAPSVVETCFDSEKSRESYA